jgi:preprotein translocase subunit YajC
LPFFGASRTNATGWRLLAAIAREAAPQSLVPAVAARHFEVMLMPISTAYAQGTGLLDQSALVQFLPLVLIFIVFYFLLIRPQQKKAKDHRTMLGALRRGDRVVTGGGIVGTVNKVLSPEEVEVDIAQGVRVRVLRSTISSVLAKPDPAAAREAAREREKEAPRREADKAGSG